MEQRGPQQAAGRLTTPTGTAAATPATGSPHAAPPPQPQPQHRRTLKDEKFHQVLQATQDGHIRAAQQQHGPQDRRSLAVAMLVQGRAQAFVDFFMLSQAGNGAGAGAAASLAGASQQQQQQQQQLPWQSMVLLQEQLVAADAADRAGDYQAAFEAHRHLARHFTQAGVLANAVCFWKRCLQVATAAAWQPGQLEARCALGLLYESLGQPALALACHEACLALSRQLGRQQDEAAAAAQLVQVYAQQAEARAGQGDVAAAAAFYAKARDAALQCGDSLAAGAASHHLGLLAQQGGDWQLALQHQRSFLECARQAGDQEAEGRACVACAECQQQLGQLDGAIEVLEAFLALSRSQAPRGQATACCKLGVLYHSRGNAPAAVSYFERCYELARSLGERRLLDLARANLGAARAALRAGAYADVALGDQEAVLAWKCGRRPF